MVEKRICKRCGGFKWSKGRGLCETCWKVAKQTGFEHYPTRKQFDSALLCRCFAPIEERLPLWNDVQCKRCGKKVVKR